FVFSGDFGQDVIVDFGNGNDKLEIEGLTELSDFTGNAMQVGSDVIYTDGDNTITIENVTLSDLQADDFAFS
ncbi:calcium-binding protein, partial [Pseudovibrio exalbescens]|nr:calcium-binding protein [Pseudovibrio exalbescens]